MNSAKNREWQLLAYDFWKTFINSQNLNHVHVTYLVHERLILFLFILADIFTYTARKYIL